jgi:DNA-binding beta-propeller fold protein YncE
MKKVLLSVLMLAAFALLSPVASSAQTTATTPADSIEATDTTASKGVVVKPMPSTTDSRDVTSVGLGSGVTSVAGDANGNVYASLQFSNKVVKLNGGGTLVGTFAVGGNPTGLIVDDVKGVLYALNNADNTVSKLGLDGTLLATLKVEGDGPVHAALLGGTLYIACERSNTLVRMSTDGLAQGSTEVGARPVWVAVSSSTLTKGGSGASVYVSCNKANQVWKLSSAGAVLAKYATGRGPFGIAFNSNGEFLVACFWDALVMRLNAVTGEIVSKTVVGDGAAGLVSYGNVVVVIENGTNSITRLSAEDGTIISKDKVDRAPLAGAATASALWVGCTGSGTIARRAL